MRSARDFFIIQLSNSRVGSNAFKGIYKTAVIKVPASKLTTYKKMFAFKGQSRTVKIQK